MIRAAHYNNLEIDRAIRDAEMGKPVDSRMLPAMLAKLRDDAKQAVQDAVEEAEGKAEDALFKIRGEHAREVANLGDQVDELSDERDALSVRLDDAEERIAKLEQDVIDAETALAEAEDHVREMEAERVEA